MLQRRLLRLLKKWLIALKLWKTGARMSTQQRGKAQSSLEALEVSPSSSNFAAQSRADTHEIHALASIWT